MIRSIFLLLCAITVPIVAENRLVLSQRAEPRTLNPVFAQDAPTRDVLRLIHGRLVRINGATLGTEAALAEKWSFSPDGRSCTLRLRRGVKFSDGQPFTADDVVFSLELYQDPKLGSPQRDLLAAGGRPLRVTKLSAHEVRLEFAEPYGPAERLFDGLAILPRHRLEKPYREGKLSQTWTLATPPGEFAGLGPFVPAAHVPGQRLVLRKNPHYWQPGKPKLNEVEIVFTADQTAEMLRFQRGETDLVQRPLARAFNALGPDFVKIDLGSSLEYHFLFFNLNEAADKLSPELQAKQEIWRKPEFRRAISLAADRAAMAKLAFDGRATPLRHHVTPGNKRWLVEGPAPRRSTAEAGRLLAAIGLRLNDGVLSGADGRPVEFTIAVNSANAPQLRMAAILQEDLRPLGIRVRIVPLEFRSLVDRVLKSLDYEAALMALGSGDADPNSEMNIWLNDGSMHVWNLSAARQPQPWETEIDQLMRRQRATLNQQERRSLYGQVQRLVADYLPIIPLVSPHLLTAHRRGLKNVQPSILPPYALWKIEEFAWESPR